MRLQAGSCDATRAPVVAVALERAGGRAWRNAWQRRWLPLAHTSVQASCCAIALEGARTATQTRVAAANTCCGGNRENGEGRKVKGGREFCTGCTTQRSRSDYVQQPPRHLCVVLIALRSRKLRIINTVNKHRHWVGAQAAGVRHIRHSCINTLQLAAHFGQSMASCRLMHQALSHGAAAKVSRCDCHWYFTFQHGSCDPTTGSSTTALCPT